MSDAHDTHVLSALIAAVRETPGAPDEAADILTRHLHATEASEAQPGGGSLLETARDMLGGLLGGGHAEGATEADAGTRALAALMGRMESAMADDRLSGPARDAVIRAFDPIKAARDAALQRGG